jgi:hypothetical protein
MAKLSVSSGDTGSGETGVTLNGAVPGLGANVTVGHTLVLIVGALALLWLLGLVVFKSIRMH